VSAPRFGLRYAPKACCMSSWTWGSVSRTSPVHTSCIGAHLAPPGCAFVYVRAAAPSDRALGATNGIAQTSISVVRTIGPALSNSLFALSHQRNILGGGFVYAVFIAITIAALGVSTYLPKELWVKSSEGTSGGVEGDVEPTQ
jgi:hypothetical protein